MSKSKRNKTGLVLLILFAVFLAAAFFTNPREQAHKDALKVKAKAIMDEIVAERSDAISAMAWRLAGEQVLGGFVNSNVSVDNYRLFSVTKIDWDGKTYPVGIGVFGRVYITKELNKEVVQPIIEDIENKITDSLPDFLK